MRKNILIFCHHYATQFINICNQYANLFDRHQMHVTVAYLCGEPNDEALKRTVADDVIFLNQSRSTVRGLKLGILWKMFCLTRKKKFQLVICHRYKPFYLYLLIEKWISIPYILFVAHDLQALKSKSRCVLIKMLARKNTYFAGVSQAMRDVLHAALKDRIAIDRVETLYNAIDMPALESRFIVREHAKQQLGLPLESFVIGTLGRLEKNKDQATLIRAFAAISSRCPEAVLLIMGEGSEKEFLLQLVLELGLTKRVRFVGFIAEGWQYLKAFDLFILTTAFKESFGCALTEAMTARVPVVGTDVGGIPEVIGRAGALVAPRDVAALSQQMDHYYHMSVDERQCWGEQGYQRIKNKFSWPSFQNTFWNFIPYDKNV